MTSTDVAIQAPRLPIRETPRRTARVSKKVFHAIELIVFDGKQLDQAAAEAGLTTYTLRQAFGRAHVIAHLKARRDVFRSAINGQNIYRLAQIRDAADNMPAVNAIKVLEQINDEQTNVGAAHSPRLTINIVTAPTSAQHGRDTVSQVIDVSRASDRPADMQSASGVTIPHDDGTAGGGKKP